MKIHFIQYFSHYNIIIIIIHNFKIYITFLNKYKLFIGINKLVKLKKMRYMYVISL